MHGDASMFVGGIRALLLQTLHPAAMRGVAEHSDYRTDMWGRLASTSTYLAMTTFGHADDAQAAVDAAQAGDFTVAKIEQKQTRRHPAPPFTTSTLQQEAARKLGFTAQRTMQAAQKLYEGVDETGGLITYMRTDGVSVSPEGLAQAREVIGKEYGPAYVPAESRHYKVKAKNAQEAHEAIRPTDFRKDKAGSGDEARLYDLIFKRALASQMATAQLERTTVTLTEGSGQHSLRATGQVVKFPGFLAVYQESFDDKDDEDGGLLPYMREGDAPARKSVEANQHFTQPPPRYSEASLVKQLEELGIGRPSTYASTIQTLRDREYVRIEKNRFFAEESGRLLTAFLERFFPTYVAYDFTAGMEEELDDVSGGRAEWKAILEAFWKDFKPKSDEVMEQKPSDITAVLDTFLSDYLFPERADGKDPRFCPLCDQEGRAGGRLHLRGGRFGAFVACENYPECKFTRRFAQPGSDADEVAEDAVLGNDPAGTALADIQCLLHMVDGQPTP